MPQDVIDVNANSVNGTNERHALKNIQQAADIAKAQSSTAALQPAEAIQSKEASTCESC